MSIRSDLEAAIATAGYRTIDLHAAGLDQLLAKLELLDRTQRYRALLHSLRGCNDRSNLRSILLEATFAHAFEAQDLPLQYEIAQLPGASSTIDFRRSKAGGNRYNFEMRLVQQQAEITRSIEDQLAHTGWYEVSFGGDGEQREIIRLQSVILSKCQDEHGRPVKFLAVVHGEFNFIVVDVSDLMLGGLDKKDCELAMYGGPGVPPYARRDVFGLFQVPFNSQAPHMELGARFEHFRGTIHGVLFLRRLPRDNPINFKLAFFLVLNPSRPLLDDDRNELLCDLRTAMSGWQNQRHGI